MLRCKQLGFNIDELEDIEYGMIEDMLTERSNDDHDYPYIANQKDFDRF